MWMARLITTMLLFKGINAFFQPLRASQSKLITAHTLCMVRKLDIRPALDDIERISYGKAAKRRGTGSRGVPHRLNEAERKEWDLAKKRRFLTLRGSGWRRERGDSPLANIYRNFCDAVGIPAISVERGLAGDSDTVIVDFSPLRTRDVKEIAEDCIEISKSFSNMAGYRDESAVDQLGFEPEIIDDQLINDVIWRIPVYSVKFDFTVRSESKLFAEQIAVKYANGKALKTSQTTADSD